MFDKQNACFLSLLAVIRFFSLFNGVRSINKYSSEMRLLERYQELVERDPDDISILWKLLHMLFYLVSAVAGYTTAYAFYTFQDILNHRCILWMKPSLWKPDLDVFIKSVSNSTSQPTEQPWQDRLSLNSRTEFHCSSVLMISMLSCACGVIGFSFFLICGRGGYQVRPGMLIMWCIVVYRYYGPWRLVVPAIVLNFCLSLLSFGTAYNFKYGFDRFQYNLNKLINQSGDEPIMEFLHKRLESSQERLLWKYFKITKASSWIGAAGWIVGFAFLILRVANVTDFRLLKVSIYAPKPRRDQLQGESPNTEPRDT